MPWTVEVMGSSLTLQSSTNFKSVSSSKSAFPCVATASVFTEGKKVQVQKKGTVLAGELSHYCCKKVELWKVAYSVILQSHYWGICLTAVSLFALTPLQSSPSLYAHSLLCRCDPITTLTTSSLGDTVYHQYQGLSLSSVWSVFIEDGVGCRNLWKLLIAISRTLFV